ncbi:MAG: hypothetical protein ABGX16_16945 [Pirellulales bacterium]
MKQTVTMLIAPLMAIFFVTSIVHECSAQAPERQQQRGQRRQAANGERRSGEGRRSPGPDRERDPAQMVARMMQQFDQDGDNKLDQAELTKLFIFMRERRGQGKKIGADSGRKRGGKASQRGRRPDGKNPQKSGKNQQRRFNGGNDKAKPGGEIPNRPPTE